jgi:hypothetical protein
MIATADNSSDWTTEMQLLEPSTATSRAALETPILVSKEGRRDFPEDETGCSVKQTTYLSSITFLSIFHNAFHTSTPYFQTVEAAYIFTVSFV